MRSQKTTLTIVMMLAFILIAVGCSSTPTPAPEPIILLAPTATLAPVDVFPTGTFTKGDWVLELNVDGTYFARDGESSSEQGDYNVTGNQISLVGNNCPNVTGTYTWSFDGVTLSFKAVSDDCAIRIGVVESDAWIKNQ